MTVTVCGLPLETAPPTEKGQKMRGWQEKLVPLVLASIAEGKDASFGDLAKAVDCASNKFVSTALGHGKGGGLKLWRSEGGIKACQQNAAICINFLHGDSEDAGSKAAADLGMEEVELLAALQQLPLAK